jgi:DinB superfamily
MSDLHVALSSVLANRYTANAARVHELAGTLTNAQFWQKPFPYGNSFGHLVLHLTGNLNYYIGAQIAKTGYVRDRPREFNEANPPTKEEALKRFDDAVAMVIKTIREQTAEDFCSGYSGVGANAANRYDMIQQCASHIQHHIGQMIYLAHEWQRQEAAAPAVQSSATVSVVK